MAVDKNPSKKKKEVSDNVKQQMQELGDLLKSRDYKDEPEPEDGEGEPGQGKKKLSKEGKSSFQRTTSNASSKSSSGGGSPIPKSPVITNQIEPKEVEIEKPKSDIQTISAVLETPTPPVASIPFQISASSSMTIVNLLEQEVPPIPILEPRRALKLMLKENAATEKARFDEIKTWEERHKKVRILEEKMGYIQPTIIVQVLKTSMRFVPGGNQAPNIYGRSDDPPYLFKDLERIVLLRIESIDRLSSSPKASIERVDEKPKDYKPAFGLAWPTDQSNHLLQKAHENMLAAFLNYYAKKAHAEESGYSGTTVYDPNLSVSCAIACGKSPYPKFLSTAVKLDVETGIPYTQITAPDIQSILSRKSIKNFIPVGFIMKDEIGVIGEIPENYVEMNLPIFPDIGLKDIGIPSGTKAGFMDSFGTFYEARAGDALPMDATIGYMDDKGVYHQVLDVESGMQGGQIEYKAGYGVRTFFLKPEPTTGVYAPLSLDEQEEGLDGRRLTSTLGASFMAGISEGARMSQYGRPAANLFSSTHHLPGDVNLHQSQALFVGVGERKTYKTDENHEKDASGRRRRKKKRPQVLDAEGELEDEPDTDDVESEPDFSVLDVIEDEAAEETQDRTRIVEDDVDDDDVDYGDYGYDDYAEYDDDDEGEEDGEGERRVHRVEGEGGEEEDGGAGGPKRGRKWQPSKILGRKPRPSNVTTVIKSEPYTAHDLKLAAPAGVSVGYLDQKGQFVEVREGEEVPVNVQTVFKDESNVIKELTPPPKAQTIMEVSKIGFKNEAGVFVEIKPGDGVPQDAVLGFLNEKGKFQKRTSDFGYIEANGEFVHLATGVEPPMGAKVGYMGQDKKFHPKPAKTGYTDATGEFVELRKNELPPAGVTLGYLDSSGTFNQEAKIPPDAEIGYVEKGVFKHLAENEEPPPGVAIGFRRASSGAFIPMQDPEKGFFDTHGVFQQTQPEVRKSNRIPPGAQMGFVDKENTFHELQPGETAPKGTPIGYKDPANPVGAFIPVTDGTSGRRKSIQIPPGAQMGFVDKENTFHELQPGETVPKGTSIGYKDPADPAGVFIPVTDGTRGRKKSIQQIPPGAHMGFVDEENTFHELQPGETVPKGTPIGYKDPAGVFIQVADGGRKKPLPKPTLVKLPVQYIENPNEIVEVEIHDDNDLDEHGLAKIKVVLRHRGSMAPPVDAQEFEGGGKVWIEGNEEVTELSYADENDKDESGKPKVKRMRVRKRLGEGGNAKGPKLGRQYDRGRHGQPPVPGDPDYDGYYGDDDEGNLRDAPLTTEERERLIEFQKNISVQCELDYVEGSLDLGEVVRKSFRIYSHGASIDIEPTIHHEEVEEPKEMEKTTSQTNLYTKDNIDDNNYWEDHEEEEEKEKNQVKRLSKDKRGPKKPYPGPK